MPVKTSMTAEVRWNNTKIAKVQNISLDITRNALDTTALGELDESAVYGVRSTSGSGTMLYDPADTTTVDLMNTILADEFVASDNLTMVLDTSNNKTISGTVLLTSTQVGVSTGDVISVPVQFKVNNKPSSSF